VAAPARPRIPWPRSAFFIVGTEACERFSFYGMRNILTAFLVGYLLTAVPAAEREPHAKSIFHLFVMAAYFTPLLGGWLADRRWGKYRTILRLSLLYCVGHGCLALFDHSPAGFYAGLGLIALGAGGIKPCVSAFVGDQLSDAEKPLAPKVFAAFYWAINLGSLTATLFIPKLLRHHGPSVAFGLPGVLMGVATLVFWLGRKHYHDPPPARAAPYSREGIRAVLRLLKVFALVPFFWMLFDQKASAWVLQAMRMRLDVGSYTFEPSQLQAINPLLVMILIPLTTGLVYPACERLGWPLTPLRRMTMGMFAAGASFVMVAAIQVALDRGHQPSVLWQLAPYVALTLGEVLVSTTGLEFAYAQAPPEMKGMIQSLWWLAVAAGNLVVAVLSRLDLFTGVASFLFYAALVTLAGVAMALVARSYVSVEYYRAEGAR
jgi:proton-dependent oligopeptide transporter, POT family